MGRQVPIRAGVGASGPTMGDCFRQSCCLLLLAGGFPLAPLNPLHPLRAVVGEKTQGLSLGQTIGAARTAVRSACCLPAFPSGRSRRKNQQGINLPAEKQGGFPLAPAPSPETIERPIGLQALLLPPACHPFTFAMYISICTVIFSKRFSRRISSGMENVMGVMQRKSDDWRSSRGNSQRTVACSKISPCPSR